MKRLPGETLPATEVEWGRESRQRPPPRQFVLALPIRDPEQFLRQHRADAGTTLCCQRARFPEQGLLNRNRDVLLHDAAPTSLHAKYV